MPPKVKKNTAKKNAVRTSKTAQPASGNESCPVVGIGASAGGIETLEVFFPKMPEYSGMAFVIIQHLSPTHKSIMAERLTKHTRMIVRQIEDSMKFEPNQVYLNPPDKNVAVFNGRLHLLERVKSSAVNMPIDFFFRSLAEERKEKAIGIILSGTASDGTHGIKAFMTRRMTRNGNLLKILLTATVLMNESGLPVELATTERDIAWLTEESNRGADEKEA